MVSHFCGFSENFVVIKSYHYIPCLIYYVTDTWASKMRCNNNNNNTING